MSFKRGLAITEMMYELGGWCLGDYESDLKKVVKDYYEHGTKRVSLDTYFRVTEEQYHIRFIVLIENYLSTLKYLLFSNMLGQVLPDNDYVLAILTSGEADFNMNGTGSIHCYRETIPGKIHICVGTFLYKSIVINECLTRMINHNLLSCGFKDGIYYGTNEYRVFLTHLP